MILDLSLSLEAADGEPIPLCLNTTDHAAGASILGESAGIGPDDFPDGLGISFETVTLTSHMGTHIDAPLHFGPICEGKPARAIDEIPLDWFYGPGVLVRAIGDASSGPVGRSEIERVLLESGHHLEEGNIVLIQTGADQRWGSPEYFTNFRGVSDGALSFVLEHGVKVVGVDSFSFDPPFKEMLDEYMRNRDRSLLWPTHVRGRSNEYCHIERLARLDRIPITHGFSVACFPIKLRGAGASWARVVAIL